MSMAIELAKKGCGWVNPNPMVGAVIVKDNKVIGKGYHKKCGEAHAERVALADCEESPFGATIYVTLEPCCHYGKTPPCTQAIIESGIKRVVVGSLDPNELVAGQGIKILEDNGIEVVTGILKEECEKLNTVFFHYINKKVPYIVMKYAMTMDGKIATYSGKSKWITGETARNNVQDDRNRYSGIMVGIGTVLEDNPMLTCRKEGGKNPTRIICDTKLKTPLDSNIVKTANQIETIIATCCDDKVKLEKYKNMGCKIIQQDKYNEKINLKDLVVELGKIGIDSILLEGGSSLNWSALESGIVNKVQTYIAPKLFGGKNAKSPIGGQGVDEPGKGFMLSNPTIVYLGEDILIESEVVNCSQE
ncbi:bifunctional diaminohydroxyphosphoribosylaminopyrimidine deaminase/5-amino-6-(5-phosphoribosylamino)uracil reductase RibD [Peptostreptococcus faecalis]|nr:bifunctional diaminohydroxyphosphoribosylaminopyrimidine deaminase/5-amino-6-(5-phosphoribosylamino)uracil reductase RibD [Peptostreptococcus faecalis]